MVQLACANAAEGEIGLGHLPDNIYWILTEAKLQRASLTVLLLLRTLGFGDRVHLKARIGGGSWLA